MQISPTLNFKDKGKVSDNDWIMILDQMIFPLSLFLPTTCCTTTPYVMTFDLSYWCHSFGLRQINPLEKWMQETSFSLCLCVCACVYIAVVQELCVHVCVLCFHKALVCVWPPCLVPTQDLGLFYNLIVRYQMKLFSFLPVDDWQRTKSASRTCTTGFSLSLFIALYLPCS